MHAEKLVAENEAGLAALSVHDSLAEGFTSSLANFVPPGGRRGRTFNPAALHIPSNLAETRVESCDIRASNSAHLRVPQPLFAYARCDTLSAD
jgi:hypothetical protein